VQARNDKARKFCRCSRSAHEKVGLDCVAHEMVRVVEKRDSKGIRRSTRLGWFTRLLSVVGSKLHLNRNNRPGISLGERGFLFSSDPLVDILAHVYASLGNIASHDVALSLHYFASRLALTLVHVTKSGWHYFRRHPFSLRSVFVKYGGKNCATFLCF